MICASLTSTKFVVPWILNDELRIWVPLYFFTENLQILGQVSRSELRGRQHNGADLGSH